MTSRDAISLKILQNYFVYHLNRIYCAKSHLAERLTEIENLAGLRDVKASIGETKEDLEKQLTRLDEIYLLLNQPGQFWVVKVKLYLLKPPLILSMPGWTTKLSSTYSYCFTA